MERKKLLVLLAMAFSLVLFIGIAVIAQEGGAPAGGEGTKAAASTEQPSTFDIWVAGGGWVGWIIIACSIATVALIIEHIITIQIDKIAPPQIVAQLQQLFEEQQYEEAMNLCESTRNYVTNVVGAALANIQNGYDSMVGAASGKIEEENTKLNHKISWLVLLGNVGPMLGLFGTVTGMVIAFTEIALSAEQPSPQQLAGGIYTALVTTFQGLIVAIPALSANFIFKNKVQKICLQVSGTCAELVEQLRPVAQGK